MEETPRTEVVANAPAFLCGRPLGEILKLSANLTQEQLEQGLAAQADKGGFTAAQLRDRLDNGRKVAIQILEFFDRHGVTLRRGDLRRVNRHRLDLFRRAAGEPAT